MKAGKQSLAASMLLAGVLVQLLGAALPALALWCVIGFYVLGAAAAVLMKTPLAVCAAVFGGVLGVMQSMGRLGDGWQGIIALNLVYLVLYLPLQAAFGRAMFECGTSRKTLVLGQRWAITQLVARGFSMMGALPYFAGQNALSVKQGAPTMLFQMQLGIEVIALLATIASYYFMARYLWRVRSLLSTGRKL